MVTGAHAQGGTDRTTRRRARRGDRRVVAAGLVMVAALLGASACAGSDDDSASFAPEAPAEELNPAAGDAGGARDEAAEREAPSPDAAVDLDLGSIGRDVIVELGVTLESDDLRATVQGITSSVAAAGGGVASSQIEYLDDDPDAPTPEGDEPSVPRPARGYAYLVVKVPPAELERIVAGLDRLGTVVSVTQSAQDVTDQLTDLEVQIANSRASVERVRSLLEEATDLSDVVLIESELTQRQIRLEQLLATQQNLSDRVALATLTIEVIPAAIEVEADEDDDGIAAAFRDGWDAFASVVAGTVIVLALLSPFLVLGLVVLGVVLLIVRRSRRRAPTAGPHRAAEATGDLPPAAPTDQQPAVTSGAAATPDDASPRG